MTDALIIAFLFIGGGGLVVVFALAIGALVQAVLDRLRVER